MWELIQTTSIGTLIAVSGGVGSVFGFYFGRWKAETGRAWFDMRRVWDHRTAYRDFDF